MQYKNISNQPVFVLQQMTRILIRPGEVVNLNIEDIQHSAHTMRFFESLAKHNIVEVNGWDKAEHKIKKDGLKHIVNTVWNGSNNK